MKITNQVNGEPFRPLIYGKKEKYQLRAREKFQTKIQKNKNQTKILNRKRRIKPGI